MPRGVKNTEETPEQAAARKAAAIKAKQETFAKRAPFLLKRVLNDIERIGKLANYKVHTPAQVESIFSRIDKATVAAEAMYAGKKAAEDVVIPGFETVAEPAPTGDDTQSA